MALAALKVWSTMDECSICGFDALSTWKCNCCLKMVCETCMPEIGTRCFICQETFPAISLERAISDVCGDAHSRTRSSDRVPISINDHLPGNEIWKKATQCGGFPDSSDRYFARHQHHDLQSHLTASHQKSQTIKDPRPLFVDALATFLKQVGVEQHNRDAVLQKVELHLEQPLAKSCSIEDRLGIGAGVRVEASRGVITSDEQKRGNGKIEGKTMMICNIPCRMRRKELVEAIVEMRFGGTFDFVHIPCRLGHSKTNLGYAFIHFFKMTDAENFAHAFEGYRFSTHKDSTKACTVKVAACQRGTESQQRIARNVRLIHKDNMTSLSEESFLRGLD